MTNWQRARRTFEGKILRMVGEGRLVPIYSIAFHCLTLRHSFLILSYFNQRGHCNCWQKVIGVKEARRLLVGPMHFSKRLWPTLWLTKFCFVHCAQKVFVRKWRSNLFVVRYAPPNSEPVGSWTKKRSSKGIWENKKFYCIFKTLI